MHKDSAEVLEIVSLKSLADKLKDPVSDLSGKSVLVGNRDELVGEQNPELGIAQTHQNLTR